MRQLELYSPSRVERRQEVFCSICRGLPSLCRWSDCPYLEGIRRWLKGIVSGGHGTSLFGASPPAVFVGEWGYPKVLAGPLAPPFSGQDTSILDSPSCWLDKSLEELLRYRFSLVRGKSRIHVQEGSWPNRLLGTFQELAMSSSSTDVELEFSKRPYLRSPFLTRYSPSGPSAPLRRARLTENPRVERIVERVVGDRDLDALQGVLSLYRHGLPQQQIAHLFSIGLLGKGRSRRLVPTEWSITAIDDMLGKSLLKRVLSYPWINEFELYGCEGVANRVQILLLPTAWMFEALEGWLKAPHLDPLSDYELSKSRGYPLKLRGAYHASRLPILEHLERRKRQAGAVAFLEVGREWIPLGVWRFRELARRALSQEPFSSSSLKEVLEVLGNRLRLPLASWLRSSKLLKIFLDQRRLDEHL